MLFHYSFSNRFNIVQQHYTVLSTPMNFFTDVSKDMFFRQKCGKILKNTKFKLCHHLKLISYDIYYLHHKGHISYFIFRTFFQCYIR